MVQGEHNNERNLFLLSRIVLHGKQPSRNCIIAGFVLTYVDFKQQICIHTVIKYIILPTLHL